MSYCIRHNFSFSLDNVMLGSKQFTAVHALIWGARGSYWNLAYALDVAYDVSSITQTNREDVEKCFDAVLNEILKKGVMQEDLAKALESETVGHKQLAQSVREKTFTPGN